MDISKVVERIASYRDAVIELERELVAIPALSPEYDPPPEQAGESRKVAFLEKYLRELGIEDLERIEAPDDRVPEGVRPSLIARIPGRSSERTTWMMVHTDVVPPGDRGEWKTDPWKLEVDGDTLYGRGVEDNHQGLVASVMVAKAIKECEAELPHDYAILFVADEECGSKLGIGYVLEQRNPFGEDDIIIVPDGGAADGSEIEVAEKAIMWARFRLAGKSCHASMPEKGTNAMRAGAHLVVRLEKLAEVFGDSDDVFDPPQSTFTPTKKEANVGAVNIMPGEDVFHLDCRVLPRYPLENVEAEMGRILAGVEKDFGVEGEITFTQREDAAPPTPVDAPVVGLLQSAIEEVYGVEAGPIGIGGGTVAAFLRRKGLPCVVWSRMEETMHTPNENASLSNILGDAQVIARVALAE
ncbi:MAG: M20 family metallo-hydrolase [Polyangia bacterium]